jgi:hypothetical protein
VTLLVAKNHEDLSTSNFFERERERERERVCVSQNAVINFILNTAISNEALLLPRGSAIN